MQGIVLIFLCGHVWESEIVLLFGKNAVENTFYHLR